jgi:TonB family protein
VLFKNDFGLSLGLHVAIFLACMLVVQQRTAHFVPSPPLIIEMDDVLSQVRKRQNVDASKQVVRTKEADNSQAPDEQAFLGERNQRVDHQRVSSQGGLRAGSKARQGAPKPQAMDLSHLGVSMLPSGRERQEAVPGDSGIREYVSGMKDGEETLLSTREFVFYGYFERIRGRLDHAWEPILRDHLIRHYRSGRRLASEMDHRTEVMVVLDLQGKIVQVEIVGESGIQTLDTAAVEAFNRAGPFPNPPRGLVGEDGRIRIKWEFILKT